MKSAVSQCHLTGSLFCKVRKQCFERNALPDGEHEKQSFPGKPKGQLQKQVDGLAYYQIEKESRPHCLNPMG